MHDTSSLSPQAHIIDGKALATQIRVQITHNVGHMKQLGLQPCLAVIIVGEDPASRVYVNNKVRSCSEVGIQSRHISLPEHVTEAELLRTIDALNTDDTVHGILVQLPLPKHLSVQTVIQRINPLKDVDGFHLLNAGALFTGTGHENPSKNIVSPVFYPCTPHGCIKMLESINYPIAGKHAVVLGRSNIVGKPAAMMLLERHATVSICHSQTPNLAYFTQSADILICAAGKAKLVTGSMVKKGAVVIDVGIHRQTDGSLCGDVDFDSVKHVAGYVSPVPGGVGPMTITMLLANTLESARYASKISS